MLAVIRIFILGVFVIVAGFLGSLFCLLRPFHRNNTALAAHVFGSMHRILGTQLDIRVPESVKTGGPFVYVANHQNSWDIFTMSASLLPGTVTIGKKSLKWVPFFGQLYWLAGNILIDRKNSSRAHGTIGTAVSAIKKDALSIWMFPEGTRSYGRGLLPFKTGAFHTAIQANVAIVPVCMSTTHEKIKLNRWNNGKIIIEMLPPVATEGYNRESVRPLIADVYGQMLTKITEIDAEANSEVSPKSS
ncbi:1-acyl-sn-glycerol-3-phosphate acyltransferase [Aliidiomarina shirensis]|uniref:1-acyl-sn-glycerol-3-phosphate acyltransferase n=1 Tax=Aliidiomarina shirensis TaxID=1048642 RepID=A0A432WKW2_9GAMM|nr:1-acylglycerol-3-phosphate O-acyltransferase [Aliidiomarina shirensis]RUO34433.1 1-acyl-sn-glycerol-3-phosphate acyltransferase [Aliidiomarina shirensis]